MDTGLVKNKFNNMFPALYHRNFRLFWFGQCISLIGTWMQNIGQSWLVLQLTNSAFKLGLVSAMQFLPMMLFSLFAGTLVDRFPKHKVLIFTQTGLMTLAVVLATLTYFNIVRYWHVLVMAALLGIINTLDMPTRQSFFIELVGKEDLMNAIALNSTIFNLARIAGPAVAGFLIGLVGIAVCFYLNAVSFIAVIAGLMLMDIPDKHVSTKGSKLFMNTFSDIWEGLRYIKSQVVILGPLILLAMTSAFVMNFNVLVPVFASQNLGQDAAGYGFLMTCMGIGSFTGALILAAKSKMGPKAYMMFAGSVGMSVFLGALGFEKSYVLACATLLLLGFCSITFTTLVNSTIQLNSSDNMRGRVMSVYSLVFGGVIPIGSMYSGNLTEAAGAPACMAISGLIGLAASAAVALLLRRRKITNGSVKTI